jgi:hypothetical protein
MDETLHFVPEFVVSRFDDQQAVYAMLPRGMWVRVGTFPHTDVISAETLEAIKVAFGNGQLASSMLNRAAGETCEYASEISPVSFETAGDPNGKIPP